MTTFPPREGDLPRLKLMAAGEAALKKHPGAEIFFKFTCRHCGERYTLIEPNVLYENGECAICGKETPIEYGGFMLKIKTGQRNHTPTVPFEAEPLASLRSRYLRALDFIWIVIPDMKNRPGETREYVFDFENGIRLIISKEQVNNHEYIHISGSVDESKMPRQPENILEIFEQYFRNLSDDNRPMKLIQITKGGIPHWVIE